VLLRLRRGRISEFPQLFSKMDQLVDVNHVKTRLIEPCYPGFGEAKVETNERVLVEDI